METKQFPVSAALSIVTGKLCGDFGEMHELAEWLIGHPIRSHEFASMGVCGRLQAIALAQHPELDGIDRDSIDGNTYLQIVDKTCERIGARELQFTKGEADRTENPLESLARIAPGKPVIVISSAEGK